jgi:acetylornithine deacetylase/succinyl-diaminopimelate desuccinylase-like protein
VVRCTITDAKARLVTLQDLGAEELTFAGKAAHSSTPHLGVNAIAKALAWSRSNGTPVLAAKGGSAANVVPARATLLVAAPREDGRPAPDEAKLIPQGSEVRPNLWRALATAGALGDLWLQILRELEPGEDPRFDPKGAVGGLNVLESGPGWVAVQLDARLLPQHDPEALLTRFEREARAWIDKLGRGELKLEISIERNAAGMALPEDSPLVKAAGGVLQRHGLDGRPRAKPTSTEAGLFFRAGCEAIVFGPGVSTGNAHTANERIEIAQLERAIDLYEALLVELCGRP